MDMLLRHYKTIFNEPEKIKEMRNYILHLAVTGKLVPQDPSDEPASELLKKIAAEKERRIAQGKIKKENPLPKITEEETSYNLPQGWEWARLREISEINPRNNLNDNLDVSFVPMKLIEDGFTNNHTYECKKWKEVKSGFTHFGENDVLIAKITPCFQNRKSVVAKNLLNGYGAGTTELYVVRRHIPEIVPEYLLAIFKTKNFIRGGVGTYTGTAGQQRVKREYIENLLIPLPPSIEQQRIVEKINEIMTICDQLEEGLLKKEETKAKTYISAINSLKNAPDEEGLKESLNFMVHNFKTFFTNKGSIKELRKGILQLAVRGKLVPQDPNDEPANELLKKFVAQKERLIAEGKIKEKPVPEITEVEIPYELPQGWEWVRLGEITLILRGSSPRPKGDSRYFTNTRTPFHWITIWDITHNSEGDKLVNTREFLTEEGSKKSTFVKKGELIVAISGSTVGKNSILDIDGYIYDGLAAIKEINNDILRDFLKLYLETFESRINDMSEGTAFPNINTETLKNLMIPLPPHEETIKILDKVAQLKSMCNQLEKQMDVKKQANELLKLSIINDCIDKDKAF